MAPPHERKCLDCGSVNIMEDRRHGCTVCKECGLVADNYLIDEQAEWRTFSEKEERGDPSRVGGPTNPLLDDHLGGTMMGQGAGYSKLNRLHMRNSSNPQDKTMQAGFQAMDGLAERLGLSSEAVKIKACTIYKIVKDSGDMKGRAEVVRAACMVMASRWNKTPRSFKEVQLLLPTVREATFNRAYKMVESILAEKSSKLGPDQDLLLSFQHPAGYMKKFANELKLTKEMLRALEAMALASRPKDEGAECVDSVRYPWDSRSPLSVAAGILYILTLIKDPVPMEHLCVVTNVSESTMRVVYREMHPYFSKLLPPGFNSPQQIAKLPQTRPAAAAAKQLSAGMTPPPVATPPSLGWGMTIPPMTTPSSLGWGKTPPTMTTSSPSGLSMTASNQTSPTIGHSMTSPPAVPPPGGWALQVSSGRMAGTPPPVVSPTFQTSVHGGRAPISLVSRPALVPGGGRAAGTSPPVTPPTALVSRPGLVPGGGLGTGTPPPANLPRPLATSPGLVAGGGQVAGASPTANPPVTLDSLISLVARAYPAGTPPPDAGTAQALVNLMAVMARNQQTGTLSIPAAPFGSPPPVRQTPSAAPNGTLVDRPAPPTTPCSTPPTQPPPPAAARDGRPAQPPAPAQPETQDGPCPRVAALIASRSTMTKRAPLTAPTPWLLPTRSGVWAAPRAPRQ